MYIIRRLSSKFNDHFFCFRNTDIQRRAFAPGSEIFQNWAILTTILTEQRDYDRVVCKLKDMSVLIITTLICVQRK